ncbi:MAG TPA: DUF29 domain-containing protein [Candidatus Acidoferrales bacterium]|nr:DUF29 domain-containing protein [Candidatus Acidoferrales bacterium]
MTADLLYEEDFYAWTQQQAELLRRLAAISNALDIEHIAEEIEDLGRSDLRAAQSLCQHIIEHLLKLEYSGLAEPVDHWRDEIVVAAPAGADFDAQHPGEIRFAGPLSDGAAARAQASVVSLK